MPYPKDLKNGIFNFWDAIIEQSPSPDETGEKIYWDDIKDPPFSTKEPLDYKFMPEGYPKIETEMVEILSETATKTTQGGNQYRAILASEEGFIKVGKRYTVVFNDKTFTSIATQENPMEIARLEFDNDYLVVLNRNPTNDSEYVLMVGWNKELGETITLSIYEEQEIVKPLDPKFVGSSKNIYYVDDNNMLYKDEACTVGVTINDLMSVLNGCVVNNGSYQNVACVNHEAFLNGFQVLTINTIGSDEYYMSTDIEYAEEG